MLENKHYSWKEIEEYVLNNIAEQNYYASPNSPKIPYTIIMPPPNVTGYLHMGHALVTTLQDVLIRYKRMKGFDTLWQPGVDHAGIATQVIVEKRLLEQGIKKQDIGRETFIEKVYEWKEHSSGRIIEQIKKMGASADFSYLAFTMDSQSVKGVYTAFARLHEAGLIYQDYKLVNWDTQLQTAISDLEVENKEVKGKMYYLKYYIDNTQDYISVATTRPETIFGDTAVAVNEEDTRYKNLIGREVIIPVVNRKVKIIIDNYADMTKGSGAVKITPAHDFNDFEVGKRNNLESINILNKDGTLNENVLTPYQGLTTAQARKKLLVELEEKELLEKAEDHLLSIPYGDRSNSVIEPFLTKQWFLNAGELAKEAIEVVKSGKIQFVPQNWENLYFEWMNNIQPWCISRQLWWGHRIPVYYAKGKDGNEKVFVASSLEEAQQKAQDYFGFSVELKQDEDVLDTWFSSSLWPFLTLGWPEDTEKLKKYYPSEVLVTAFDIIFFWVARMIMMGVFFMKEVPFKKVYIHALIRDERGQKMSKSKGNVIDPLDIIEKYGTDALRFTLAAYSGQGRDIKLSEQTIEGYRNFVTKIWNSYKFCHQNGMVYNQNYNPQQVNLDINKWILYRLEELQKNVDIAYDSFKFNEVANLIYQFIWGNYCDWYIELSKPILYANNEANSVAEVQQTMGFVFDKMLRILHPLMPFISQYLFENLHKNNGLVLATENLPSLNFGFTEDNIKNTTKVVNLISKIRSIRVDLNIPQSAQLKLVFEGNEIPQYIRDNFEVIKKVARVQEIIAEAKLPADYVLDVVDNNVIGLPLKDIINMEAERIRIQKSIDKLNIDREKLDSKLNNQQFMAKANAEVIATFKSQHVEISEKISKLTTLLAKIS
ncbi:MAG: valine--tRNA ligase [Alphaproteobacteria bacterium]|jgi:valyl-tRNA synthetase|nr:valine--tRNA ligase [Alphaproteobacteria bacterium]